MKKIILLASGILVMGAGVSAQNNKVRTAEEYLQEQNYKKAIPPIDEAVANEATKGSARAWYVRGMAYLQKALDTTAKSPDASDIASASFMKALELDPKFDADQIKNPLYSTALISFNKGVASYRDKDYSGAYNSFNKVSQIYSINGGKLFAGDNAFAKDAQNAKAYAAYSALNNQQYDLAAPILEDIRKTQTVRDSNVYQSLVDIYSKQNNDEKLINVLTDARQYFPNSEYFRNQEINYYIRTGKSDVLLGKLEEASAKDPNNTEILFNLANGYEKIAYPVDQNGKDLPPSPQSAGAFDKAEKAYQRLLSLNDKNSDYAYNTAVLYYSRAASLTKQLADIKGSSPAEKKQYDAILAERNKYFDTALPYFEKAYNLLDPKAGNLSPDEKVTYRNAMVGMREIYSRKNNKVKTDELGKKISAIK